MSSKIEATNSINYNPLLDAKPIAKKNIPLDTDFLLFDFKILFRGFKYLIGVLKNLSSDAVVWS